MMIRFCVLHLNNFTAQRILGILIHFGNMRVINTSIINIFDRYTLLYCVPVQNNWRLTISTNTH